MTAHTVIDPNQSAPQVANRAVCLGCLLLGRAQGFVFVELAGRAGWGPFRPVRKEPAVKQRQVCRSHRPEAEGSGLTGRENEGQKEELK